MYKRFRPAIFLSIILLAALAVAAEQTLADGDVPNPVGKPPVLAPLIQSAVAGWTHHGSVLLAVDTADAQANTDISTDLPVLDPVLAALPTPEGIAAANGYQSVWYGKVMAIAPNLMTVINDDPDLYNLPLSRLEAVDPWPYLLCSLTQQQFDMLSSEGLGINDLTSDQQPLFAALVPDPLKFVSADIQPPAVVMPDATATEAQKDELARKYTADLDDYNKQIISIPASQSLNEVRLHLYIHQRFIVNAGEANSADYPGFNSDTPNTGPTKLVGDGVRSTDEDNAASKYLQSLFIIHTPNTLKPSQIDWKIPALSAKVSVLNIKTVDDLVNAIRKATKLELYADPRYGDDSVYFGGDLSTPQPAANLMQALNLCVCGTWRQVGPAYVLTNDIEGLNSRYQFLRDVVESWSNRMSDISEKASMKLIDSDWLTNLTNFPGDNDELSKEQLQEAIGSQGSVYRTTTWDNLPTNVQTQLQQGVNEKAKKNNNDESGDSPSVQAHSAPPIQPGTPVKVRASLTLALEVPGNGIMNFQYPYTELESPNALEESTDFLIQLSKGAHGVIIAPKTADEARKAIDMLPGMGMTTAIVDVFNNGRAYFPNTSMPPENQAAASVLEAALKEGALKHITILAAVDLLCWKNDASMPNPAPWPTSLPQDIDFLGETSSANYRRRLDENSLSKDIISVSKLSKGDKDWVSPLEPKVHEILPILVKTLARTHGIAGIVFQETAPFGYGVEDIENIILDLGYSLNNRNSFLRRHKIDPLDISDEASATLMSEEETEFSFTVPEFNDLFVGSEDWDTFRADADTALLNECFTAAKSASKSLPLFMREQRDGESIAPWDTPESINRVDEDDLPTYTDAPIPIVSLTDRNQNDIGTALDLATGTSRKDVPTLLKSIAPHLIPPPSPAFNLLMKMLGLPEQ
jgi:hypothetical protein